MTPFTSIGSLYQLYPGSGFTSSDTSGLTGVSSSSNSIQPSDSSLSSIVGDIGNTVLGVLAINKGSNINTNGLTTYPQGTSPTTAISAIASGNIGTDLAIGALVLGGIALLFVLTKRKKG